MHKSNIINITLEEVIPTSQKLFTEKRRLVIMNGYIDEQGEYCIAYNYDVDGDLVTYLCKSDKPNFKSITSIYGGSAQWCEEEICEMMPVSFDGLEKSGRLFLPDDFDGSGQILVLPLSELKKDCNCGNQDCKLNK